MRWLASCSSAGRPPFAPGRVARPLIGTAFAALLGVAGAVSAGEYQVMHCVAIGTVGAKAKKFNCDLSYQQSVERSGVSLRELYADGWRLVDAEFHERQDRSGIMTHIYMEREVPQ